MWTGKTLPNAGEHTPPLPPWGAPSKGEEIQGAVFKKIRVSPQL